ncbi:Serine/threonine-protein phosphatase 7 long form homolog, partial [Striga hermonthica]
FDWVPYQMYIQPGLLPDQCTRDRRLWMYKGWIFCWNIREPHQPDRVLRQFGCHQPTPQTSIITCLADWEVHHRGQGMTGRAYTDWRAFHSNIGRMWTDERHQNVLSDVPVDHFLQPTNGYTEWYYSRTVRLLTDPNNYATISQGGGYQPYADREKCQ